MTMTPEGAQRVNAAIRELWAVAEEAGLSVLSSDDRSDDDENTPQVVITLEGEWPAKKEKEARELIDAETLYGKLREMAEAEGFVSDEADEMLGEAARNIAGDPRNTP